MDKEMFIQISDCKLYAKLVGKNKGKPTVIMDAGYGDFSKAWNSVLREISMLSSVMIELDLGKVKKVVTPEPAVKW